MLALLSALVLVSNTMTTLIGEQTGEIAAMKAIGARRRDIRRVYLRTALLLGALGALLGAALGVLLANALAGFFASAFFYIDAGFGISVPALVASVVAGLAGPPLAALPAVRRASRLPLNEALQASGGDATGLDIAFVFPLAYVAIALVGTVILALAVMLAPLRRAVRFKPGEALRYA